MRATVRHHRLSGGGGGGGGGESCRCTRQWRSRVECGSAWAWVDEWDCHVGNLTAPCCPCPPHVGLPCGQPHCALLSVSATRVYNPNPGTPPPPLPSRHCLLPTSPCLPPPPFTTSPTNTHSHYHAHAHAGRGERPPQGAGLRLLQRLQVLNTCDTDTGMLWPIRDAIGDPGCYRRCYRRLASLAGSGPSLVLMVGVWRRWQCTVAVPCVC